MLSSAGEVEAWMDTRMMEERQERRSSTAVASVRSQSSLLLSAQLLWLAEDRWCDVRAVASNKFADNTVEIRLVDVREGLEEEGEEVEGVRREATQRSAEVCSVKVAA